MSAQVAGPFPPAVNLDLSLSCANRDHDDCPGCDMCTCHDRGPVYTIAANLLASLDEEDL